MKITYQFKKVKGAKLWESGIFSSHYACEWSYRFIWCILDYDMLALGYKLVYIWACAKIHVILILRSREIIARGFVRRITAVYMPTSTRTSKHIWQMHHT